jgi:hypothetical protein
MIAKAIMNAPEKKSYLVNDYRRGEDEKWY